MELWTGFRWVRLGFYEWYNS